MDENLFQEFINREIQTMDIYLISKVERTAVSIEEYFRTRIVQGIPVETIRQELRNDFLNNGRIFGEFRNAVKATARGNMLRLRDIGQFSESGIEQKYRWVAILVNTCPDCIDRHNKIMSWSEWEAEGLPRTGHTVCKDNCKCALLPEDTTEIEPIRRNR